jgi:hypothetical protein
MDCLADTCCVVQQLLAVCAVGEAVSVDRVCWQCEWVWISITAYVGGPSNDLTVDWVTGVRVWLLLPSLRQHRLGSQEVPT